MCLTLALLHKEMPIKSLIATLSIVYNNYINRRGPIIPNFIEIQCMQPIYYIKDGVNCKGKSVDQC